MVRAPDERREFPDRTVPAVARVADRPAPLLRVDRAPVLEVPEVARGPDVVDLVLVAPVFAAPFFWAPAVAFEAMPTD